MGHIGRVHGEGATDGVVVLDGLANAPDRGRQLVSVDLDSSPRCLPALPKVKIINNTGEAAGVYPHFSGPTRLE